MPPIFSSSDSSTTAFLRDAARRVGLVGDIVAIDVLYFLISNVNLGVAIVCLPVSLIGCKLRRYHSTFNGEARKQHSLYLMYLTS